MTEDEDASVARKRSASMSSVSFIHQGNLKKLGEVHKTWKRRFFGLASSGLYYYKDQHKQKKALGIISLVDAVIGNVDRVAHTFELVVPTRVYKLEAASQVEMNEWIGHLKNVSQSYHDFEVCEQISASIKNIAGSFVWQSSTVKDVMRKAQEDLTNMEKKVPIVSHVVSETSPSILSGSDDANDDDDLGLHNSTLDTADLVENTKTVEANTLKTTTTTTETTETTTKAETILVDVEDKENVSDPSRDDRESDGKSPSSHEGGRDSDSEEGGKRGEESNIQQPGINEKGVDSTLLFDGDDSDDDDDTINSGVRHALETHISGVFSPVLLENLELDNEKEENIVADDTLQDNNHDSADSRRSTRSQLRFDHGIYFAVSVDSDS